MSGSVASAPHRSVFWRRALRTRARRCRPRRSCDESLRCALMSIVATRIAKGCAGGDRHVAVSYTHLTLPTNREV